MTIVTVSVHELDNETWLSCTYNGKFYNTSASSYLEAENKLRILIKNNNPGLHKDDIEFEKA